jgi:hypothetical protein
MPVHFSVSGKHARIAGGRGGGPEVSTAFVSPVDVGLCAASRIGNGVGSHR